MTAEPHAGQLSVLVIDDQLVNRTLLLALLNKLGYRSHAAADGMIALEMLDHYQPDIILIDLMMPIMDGFQTMTAIRQRPAFASVPIIAISALENTESIVQAIDAGADDYLTKPVRLAILSAKLRRIADGIHIRRSRAELEARNLAIGEALPDAMISVNEIGTIEWANAATETIFGYPPANLLGHNVSLLLPEDKRHEQIAFLRHYQETGELPVMASRRRVDALHASGHVFPAELSVVPLQLNGTPHFLGIVRDLSQAEQLERMKQDFVSVINHELRTPLTSIIGSLSLLMAGAAGELPPKAARMVEMAERNTRRLGRLINDILDLDKIDSGALQLHLQSQKLVPLLRESIHLGEGGARTANVQLQLDLSRLDDPELSVRVDADRLQQVLSNLLSNAIKFSPSGSMVTLSAATTPDSIVISIADQGPGIPVEFRSRIFQRFAQHARPDTRQREGSGLGLSITKALVEQMGGQIAFDTEIERGARFYFSLPRILAIPPSTEENT